MKFKNTFVVIVSLVFSVSSFAANQAPKLDQKASRWLDASWIELVIKDNQNDWLGNWQIAFDHPSNNVQIDKDDQFNGQRLKGSLIVINGETLLAKGLNLQPGYEIDALDTPVLMTQLLLTLLDKAVDISPSSLTNKHNIEHHEATMPIRVATKSASAFFKAPWSVSGELTKTGKQNVNYKLEFQTVLGEDIKYIVSMSGLLNHQAAVKLDDEMPLAGWTVYSLGPTTEGQFSYGAQELITSATTIGQLRQQLKNKP